MELLVAIALIAILSAMLLTLGPSSRRFARDAVRKSDLEQIRSALELYRNSNSGYPTALPTLVPGGYASSIPTDPSSPSRTYYYSQSGVTYNLCASLEKWMGATPTPQPGCAGAGVCGTGCNYRVIQP